MPKTGEDSSLTENGCAVLKIAAETKVKNPWVCRFLGSNRITGDTTRRSISLNFYRSNASRKPTLGKQPVRPKMTGDDIVDSEKNPPKILWHYTSLDTLTKILESKHLRMSNIFYMNDSMEHLLLRKLAAKTTTQKIPQEKVCQKFIKAFKQKHAAQIYSACLSAEGDLLTQWRAYGDDGSGVAIGFRPRYFVRKNGTYLYKVFYDQAEHKAICDYFLNFDFDDESSEFKRQFSRMLQNSILVNLFTQAARCKSKGFESEQEYRIVHKVHFEEDKDKLTLSDRSYSDRLGFHVDAKKRLVPFVPFPIDIIEGIAEIKLGPKNKDDKTKESLEMLLDTLGIPTKKCKVTKSKLTYR